MGSRAALSAPASERWILGSVFLSSGPDVLSTARARGLGFEDFDTPAHRAIFVAMTNIADAGHPVDPVAVEQRLRERGELRLVGDISTITALTEHGSTRWVGAAQHVERVIDKARRRNLHETITMLERELTDGHVPDAQVIESAAKVSVVAASRSDSMLKSSRAVVRNVVQAFKDGPNRVPVRTGIHNLDRMIPGGNLRGVFGHSYVMIAGRPKNGKSALADAILSHASFLTASDVKAAPDIRPHKHPALVFSLEMSAELWTARHAACEARLDSERLFESIEGRPGLSEADLLSYYDVLEAVSESPVTFYDHGGTKIDRLIDIGRTWHRATIKDSRSPGIIVIDHASKIGAKGSMYERATAVSDGILRLAKATGAVVILLSQMSRKAESRDDPRPRASDIRDSGAFEQDATMILGTYLPGELNRDVMGNPRPECARVGEVILCASRRGAPRGNKTILGWLGESLRWEDPEKANISAYLQYLKGGGRKGA